MRRSTILLGATISLAAHAHAQAPDGATLFKNQCGTCHVLDPAQGQRQGPPLGGVIGRQAGTAPGFAYSPHLANAGFAWDEAKLDQYLTNPQAMIQGGVMPYRQSKPEVRRAVIDYLKEQR